MLASTRHHILARDGYSCVVARLIGSADECAGALHVHHIIPRTQGGTDNHDNLITVCATHHGPLEAFRRKLTRDLPPCGHHHPYPQGRADCDRRRRQALLAA